MPHFDIRHSRNFEELTDVQALCDVIAGAMLATGMFPHAGIRVRAIACDAYVVADAHPENAFADMVLRLGVGRPEDARRAAGEAVWAAICAHLSPLFDRPHFALSFEMRELGPLSWKKNSIHPRLAAAG
ncbi:MAG: 5-carboxymethyl-2-hydroxymuconate isomerase [Paracoccaceae bacterium]|jgi:5-carboxymethyl-2-hydroxymuconate isomerase